MKLIQDIKNSARIYVHRIGFDPPPIKEDKRLSGDLKEVNNFYKNEDLEAEVADTFMKKSIAILESVIGSNQAITDTDKEVFAKAGNELAILAISEPGKYLETLQQLKRLTEVKAQRPDVLRAVQSGLLKAVAETDANPTIKTRFLSELDRLMIKELEASDK